MEEELCSKVKGEGDFIMEFIKVRNTSTGKYMLINCEQINAITANALPDQFTLHLSGDIFTVSAEDANRIFSYIGQFL